MKKVKMISKIIGMETRIFREDGQIAICRHGKCVMPKPKKRD